MTQGDGVSEIIEKTVTLTDKINITDKARESICNQGIDKYLFIGAFYGKEKLHIVGYKILGDI
jgi:hypothetical protein